MWGMCRRRDCADTSPTTGAEGESSFGTGAAFL